MALNLLSDWSDAIDNSRNEGGLVTMNMNDLKAQIGK